MSKVVPVVMKTGWKRLLHANAMMCCKCNTRLPGPATLAKAPAADNQMLAVAV